MSSQVIQTAVFGSCGFPQFLSPLPDGRPSLNGPAALSLPPAFAGHFGSNRAAGNCHAAVNDLDALRNWLDRFAAQPATLASYRREVERLLFWALLDRQKPLSSLTADDMVAYPSFLANPLPSTLWVTERGRRLSREHDDWRPFAGPLSSNSARQSLAVVSRLFAWLSDTGYLLRNPMQGKGDVVEPSSALAIQLLQEDFLCIIKVVTKALPDATEREHERAERSRWLFSLLCYGGLRIPEISRHTMGAFRIRPLGDSGEWWITLDESRGVRRRRPAALNLMKALVRYRVSQGLPPLPESHESTPLILPIGGRNEHLQPRVLHGIVKAMLDDASRLACEMVMGGDGGNRARGISPRWLRQLSENFCETEADESSVTPATCDEVDSVVSKVLHARKHPELSAYEPAAGRASSSPCAGADVLRHPSARHGGCTRQGNA